MKMRGSISDPGNRHIRIVITFQYGILDIPGVQAYLAFYEFE